MTPYTPKSQPGRSFLRLAIEGNRDRTRYAHLLKHIRNAEGGFSMRHAHAWLDWLGYPIRINRFVRIGR